MITLPCTGKAVAYHKERDPPDWVEERRTESGVSEALGVSGATATNMCSELSSEVGKGAK